MGFDTSSAFSRPFLRHSILFHTFNLLSISNTILGEIFDRKPSVGSGRNASLCRHNSLDPRVYLSVGDVDPQAKI